MTRRDPRLAQPIVTRGIVALVSVALIVAGCSVSIPETRSQAADITTVTSQANGSTTSSPTVDAKALRNLVDSAMHILETESLVSGEIDWLTLRSEVAVLMDSVDSLEGARSVIQYAVDAVAARDHHSFFVPAEDSEEQSLTVAAPAVVEARNSIGYIEVGSYFGIVKEAGREYAQAMQDDILRVYSEGVCGWVVNLWEHTGGNMWPGLAGLMPLLGDGIIGFLVSLDGDRYPLEVSGPAVLLNGQAQITVGRRVSDPLQPVAVVIGPDTASAGEAIALAFRAGMSTRLIGQFTQGRATANDVFELDDGSIIVLTTLLIADRNGDAPGLNRAIRPEDIVGIDADETKAIEAAKAWIVRQPGC